MPTEPSNSYRKVSGVHGTLFAREQLWVGSDHLLLVRTSFAVESYRRFYFPDIEAVVIRPTNNRRNWIIANSICCGLFLFFCIAVVGRNPTSNEVAAGIFHGSVAALFLFGLLWQIFRGPSCASYLQVRTGQERLAAVSRLRGALRLRERLAALIGASAEARAVAPSTP